MSDIELCKPLLKLRWRVEESIRTGWTIPTLRTQSAMQKVFLRMTPLTRITGWVSKISGSKKIVCSQNFFPRQIGATKLVRTSRLLSPLTESASPERHQVPLCGSSTQRYKVDSWKQLEIIRLKNIIHRSPSVARTTVREGRSPSKVAHLFFLSPS